MLCERGSSTVMAVLIGTAMLGLTAGLGLGAQAFFAHARADSIADLAALAAADAARGRTPGDACALAEHIAQEGGAAVTECTVRPDLGSAKIVVEVSLPAPFGSVEAAAVAGPHEPLR